MTPNTGNQTLLRNLAIGMTILAIAGIIASLFLMNGGVVGGASGTGNPGGGPSALATTTDLEPEGCPDNYTPKVEVSTGHYAVFDTFWDDHDHHDGNGKINELRSNPCAAELTNWKKDTTTSPPKWKPTRTQSNFDIHQTVMHVGESSKQSPAATVSRLKNPPANTTRDTDDVDRYPFAYTQGEDGTNDLNQATENWNRKSGYENLWVLPYCGPGYTGTKINTGGLCIAFSAALLNSSEWVGTMQYQFDSIRQYVLDEDRNHKWHTVHGDRREVEYPEDYRGHVAAFWPHDAIPAGQEQVTWTTDDVARNSLDIQPGAYQHRYWAFTKPGVYTFEVHMVGSPNPDATPSQSAPPTRWAAWWASTPSR